MPDLADIEREDHRPHQGASSSSTRTTRPARSTPTRLLQGIVEIARRHQLIVFADEIYDKILYDGADHTPRSPRSPPTSVCLTFNGLSKNYRVAGFRVRLDGGVGAASSTPADYIEGLDMLAYMRLCANMPAQYAIQTALGGRQSINDLVLPGGRLLEQRDLAYELLNEIPGVTCVKPKGALYVFPRLDPKVYPIEDDQQFVLDLLRRREDPASCRAPASTGRARTTSAS